MTTQTAHITFGAFSTRKRLTARLFGRNQDLAQGKISASGLNPLPFYGVQPPKTLCAVFSMGRTLGSTSVRRFRRTVGSISSVRLTRNLNLSEPDLTLNYGASVMPTEHMRKIARQKTYSKTDMMMIFGDVIDLIKLNHQIAIYADNDASPYEGDIADCQFNVASLLRDSLQEAEDMLYPVEAAERKHKEAKARAALMKKLGDES